MKKNAISANHKMTFMERAALRAECKRLTRFLRMVDIMMNDFLVTMIKEALENITAADCRTMGPRIETEDTISLVNLVTKRKELSLKVPFFRISANFKKEAPPSSSGAKKATRPRLLLQVNQGLSRRKGCKQNCEHRFP